MLISTYTVYAELHYCRSSLGQLECILQCAVTQLFTWLVANKLNLSVHGTRQCIIGKTLNVSLNNVPLKQVSTVLYLGVYIDQHLTWHNHVEYIL